VAADEQRTISLVVTGPIAPADVRVLCERARGLLQGGNADLFVCLDGSVAADVVAIELLARLQLAARRAGRRVLVGHGSASLQDLLTFLGLDDVVPCRRGLPLEAGRQAEEREQAVGVEEGGELDHPPT
jgi:STAS domain